MQDIVQAGAALPLKHKITLLDRIVDKKEQFKDEHLLKLVQSDKYSIRRLVKNIQQKIQEKKGKDDQPLGLAEAPDGDSPATQELTVEVQATSSKKIIEEGVCKPG